MSQRQHVEPLHYSTSNLQVSSHKPSQYFDIGGAGLGRKLRVGAGSDMVAVGIVVELVTDKTQITQVSKHRFPLLPGAVEQFRQDPYR